MTPAFVIHSIWTHPSAAQAECFLLPSQDDLECKPPLPPPCQERTQSATSWQELCCCWAWKVAQLCGCVTYPKLPRLPTQLPSAAPLPGPGHIRFELLQQTFPVANV